MTVSQNQRLNGLDNYFDLLISEASTSLNTISDLSIVEFAEKVIFNGEAYLYVQQKAVLKSFYGEPLTPEEEDILNSWSQLNKTNWVPNRPYKDLILEVGRGGCPSMDDKVITNKGTIKYRDLLDNSSSIFTFQQKEKLIGITSNILTWDKGLCDCVEVVTESGRKEIVTLDHPYLIYESDSSCKWLRAQYLTSKNKLYSPVGLKIFGPGDSLSEDVIISTINSYKEELTEEVISLIETSKQIIHGLFFSYLLSTLKYSTSYLLKGKKEFLQLKYFEVPPSLLDFIQRECSKWGLFFYANYKDNSLLLKDIDSFTYLKDLLEIYKDKHKSIESLHELICYNLDSGKCYSNITRKKFGEVEYVLDGIYSVLRKGKKPVLGLEVVKTSTIVNSFISHNSKSLMASIISLYEFNNLISLEDPARYYNLISNDPIAIFLIATTATQVKETLFLKLKGYLRGSEFFRNLESKKKIEVLADQVRCPDKNVAIYAKHTNSDALVGYNLKCLILDEVARFSNKVREDGNIVSLADTIWRNVGKGCFDINSYIYTNKGFIKAIELLKIYQEEEYDNSISISSYSNDSYKYLIWADDIDIWNNGLHPTVEIVTENSYSERVTLNHPFFVYKEEEGEPKWIEAEYINEGDYVSLPKCLPVSKRVMNYIDKSYPNFFEFISYVFTFGTWFVNHGITQNHAIELTKGINPEILQVIDSLLKEIEGYRFNINDKSCSGSKYRIFFDKQAEGYNLLKDLTEKGYLISSYRSFHNDIPTFVDTLPYKELRAFLKGFFTSNCTFFNILDPYKIAIKLPQETEDGAKRIQRSLLIFGIISCIKREPVRLTNSKFIYDANVVCIKGCTNILTLLDNIGLSTSDHKEMLDRVNYYLSKYPDILSDKTPTGLLNVVNGNNKNKSNSISNVRWERVTNIINHPKSLTVGIEIRESGLIANPILSHNTQRFAQDGKRVAISSGWYEGDPIQKLREKAQMNPHQISFFLKTWDLNKNKSASRESCESDYIDDRIRAELEYEGIRHKSENGLFTELSLDLASKGISVIDTEEVNLQVGDRRYVGVAIRRIERNESYPSFIHLDLSLKRDATGLCLTHIDIDEEKNWTIVVDALIKWTPYTDGAGYKRVVSFLNVEEVLLKLCEERNVVRITFDSWNSASTIQRLHSKGIVTDEVSASRSKQKEYYLVIRDLLNQGRILLPKDSVYRVQLISELVHLVMKDNGSIVHGIYGKDLSDAFVNSCYQVYKRMVETGVIKGYKPSINSLPSNLVNTVVPDARSYTNPMIQSGRDKFKKMKSYGII